MDIINSKPAQQAQSSPPPPPQAVPPQTPVQPPQAPPPPPKKQGTESGLRTLWIALAMFVIGVAGGILLFITYPISKEKAPAVIQNISITPSPIAVPKDAVKIQNCVENKGSLYMIPSDSSFDGFLQGPIYMVNKNEVIGYEFTVNQNKLDTGVLSENLKSLNINIDHIKTGLLDADLSTDAAGSFSYIDLYLIDVKSEQAIKCPDDSITPKAGELQSEDLTGTPPEPSISIMPSLTLTPSQDIKISLTPTEKVE